MSICIYIYLIIVQKIQSFFSCCPVNLTRNYISGALVELFFVRLFTVSYENFETILGLFFKIKDNLFIIVQGHPIFY